MKIRSASLLLLLLIPLMLIIVSLSTPYFDSADLPIKLNSEYLEKNGEFRLFEDSFGGRPVMRIQGFEFFFAFLSKLGSDWFATIIVLLIYSSSAYIVYLISLKTTQSPAASWFSVLLIGSSPILISNAMSFHEVLLALPLILLSIYLFMQNKINIVALIVLFSLLTFINFASAYLIFIFGVYFVILNAIGSKVGKQSYESLIILISILIGIVTLFSIVFQDYGVIPIFYNNLPPELMFQNFSGLSILLRVFSPGILVILFAAIGSYYVLSRANEKGLMPFSMLITSLVLVLFSSNKLFLGLFAVSASIIASHGISSLLQWISLSKANNYKSAVFISLGLLIIALGTTQAIFSINEITSEFPNDNELNAYEYLNDKSGLVFTTFDLANKVEYYSNKGVFAKEDFSGISEPSYYYGVYNQILSSRSSIESLRLIQENEIDYLVFKESSIPFFLQPEVYERRCFNRVEFGEVSVYEVICGVRV